MNPGATTAPAASTVRAAVPLNLPISTILPSLTPTSPRYAGIPEPSTTRPLRINRSYAIGLSPLSGSPSALPERTVAQPRGGATLACPDTTTHTDLSESPLVPDLPALRAERAALEQSIEARQRDLGPDHPDLAADLRALGRLAHDLGDFQDAQSLLHRALALYTESVGAEHPETATTINHIGLVLHDLADLDAAAAAFERALALDEQALGREHVNVARDCNNLGGVMRDMGDRFAAKEALDWALSVYMAQLGPDHPTTKSVKRNRSLLG